MKNLELKEYFYNTKNSIKNIFKEYGRILFIGIFVIIFIVLINLYSSLHDNGNIKIHFFDIGQGDAILIETNKNKNILIDAGPNDSIVRKLDDNLSFWNRNIDLGIMTHGDADHITGFVYVLNKFNIKSILVNGDENIDSSVYSEVENKIKKEIKESGSKLVIANCGDEISFGDSGPIMYVLHPIKDNLILNDTNTNSVVTLLIYGKYSFLFTGDADKEVEKKLFFDIDKCYKSDVASNIKEKLKNLTVLKVSHHGSNTGSSEEFLKKIKPDYSVISAGKDNRYGHPNPDTLTVLNKYSKNILNTINDGDITFETDGKNLRVEKSR